MTEKRRRRSKKQKKRLKGLGPKCTMQSVTWIMSPNQCFVMLTKFYSILFSYRCCVELYTCPFIVWNSSDPKDKFSFQAIIMNNKFLLYLYLSDLHAMW